MIVWRLFQLYRSVDLERARRAVSEVNGKCYRLAKRKGWTEYRWEQDLSFPSNPDASPWHLLLLYAKLTEHLLPKGTKEAQPLFWSLSRPYKPIGAKRIAALTKSVLQAHGVDTWSTVWRPHSTRGDGVDMFSSWGIAPEVVCQIGSWSNLEAFRKHYMRLNAVVGCSVLGRGAEHPQFWVLLIWWEPGISHVTWVHYDATMCLPCFVCSILPVLHFLRFDLSVL